MKKEYVLKTIRSFLCLLMFVCVWEIIGVDTRQAQQQMLMLGSIVLFGLVLGNIWATLFVWWSVFLYSFYQFQVGNVYITNIFIGAVLYYLVKISYTRESTPFYINAVKWLIFANIGFMFLQMAGLDPWHVTALHTVRGYEGTCDLRVPAGIMGLEAGCATLIAIVTPIFASRGTKWGWAIALGMFIPLYINTTTSAVIGAICGILFVAWYRMDDKRLWWGILAGLFVLAGLYVVFVDFPMGYMNSRPPMWKLAVRDCIVHPVIGWGLDSFRNVTSWKQQIYVMNPVQHADGSIFFNNWDNAHNLYVQVLYEWGGVGLFLLIGYMRDLCLRFRKSVKHNDMLALAGMILVFFVVSIGQFPVFLARFTMVILPMFALFEMETNGDRH